jgi:hypothetical protein
MDPPMTADEGDVEIQAAAAMQVQSMSLGNVRDQLRAVQANPIPANASAADHASVILSLSTAASALLTSS